MRRLSFSRLVDLFSQNLEQLGATIIRSERPERRRPASLKVVTSEATTDCSVFLWTITAGGGGGGERPRNERRIQVTNANSMSLRPGIRTLLGGWSPEFEVFAFWDARRHTRYSPNSPSLQVKSNTLEAANRVGIATYLRPAGNGLEVVVAVHPDSLLWYIQHGSPLHNAERDALGVETLVSATPDVERELIDSAADEFEAARRYDLVETMRAYREAKFKPAVLRAYRNRCAVCGYALKLVDAAHIVPVSHPRSIDCVTNGLALCRLHHGAYDNGLLGIRSDFSIVVHPQVRTRLAELHLDSGLEDFTRRLPSQISLPTEIEVRPQPDFLRLGLEARRWPSDLIS